jgi:hypothetical protein
MLLGWAHFPSSPGRPTRPHFHPVLDYRHPPASTETGRCCTAGPPPPSLRRWTPPPPSFSSPGGAPKPAPTFPSLFLLSASVGKPPRAPPSLPLDHVTPAKANHAATFPVTRRHRLSASPMESVARRDESRVATAMSPPFQ